MKTLLTILTASICLYTARGAPIEYSWTATGSGYFWDHDVGTNSFTDALFTINATADTDHIYFPGSGQPWELYMDAATVVVTGVGSADFHDDTKIFVDNDPSGVASMRFFQELLMIDGNIAVVNPVFETYDPRTAIGPVSGPFDSWDSNPEFWLESGEYQLIKFYGESISTVTFEAKLIPEPSVFAMLVLGSLTLVMVRRRW